MAVGLSGASSRRDAVSSSPAGFQGGPDRPRRGTMKTQLGSRADAADAAIHRLPPREPAADDATGRNPGMPLDLDLVAAVEANLSAIERRAATLLTRRTVKKDWQA